MKERPPQQHELPWQERTGPRIVRTTESFRLNPNSGPLAHRMHDQIAGDNVDRCPDGYEYHCNITQWCEEFFKIEADPEHYFLVKGVYTLSGIYRDYTIENGCYTVFKKKQV